MGLRSLRARLLAAFLVVAAAALGTVAVAVLLVGPGYFAEAMGHMPGDPMGEAMGEATQVAFEDAMRQALLAATVIAVATATVVSLAVAARIARPISALAVAARRVAGGHYAERVPSDEPGELGELAESFNDMAGSLESTERRRVQLVGDVAHELRTPLATIDGYLEGLEDGVIEARPETWRLLRSETARLTRMVSDLSELWRAEARQLPLEIERVDASEVAREVVERFRPQARARGIEVEVREAPAAALADRDRLAQVVSNYLSNALRHAPDGSRIVVEVVERGATVRLVVADEGPGLAPEQLEAVFERF
jgi:signal transduction histidine kinase